MDVPDQRIIDRLACYRNDKRDKEQAELTPRDEWSGWSVFCRHQRFAAACSLFDCFGR